MIYILTGSVHSGKTGFLKGVVQDLQERGRKITGFLSVSIWDGDVCMGYDLHDLSTRETHPFIRRAGDDTWQRIGKYFFIPETLERAKDILKKTRDADLLVVDEVGPLELSGKGMWPALKDVISHSSVNYLLVVRENILEDFLRMVKEFDIRVFRFQDDNIHNLMMSALSV
jgi:nucleoside-triphosphatase THEP1